MKLSIFTTASNPHKRGDNFEDAIECYSELADEVVVVDGGSANHLKVLAIPYSWPAEFSWEFIGQQFTRGYEAATGDWVLHCDLDFLFHQKDFAKIRQALKDYPDSPAVSFYKWQFILPDRYNLKSRLMLAVNKKKFGDRITFTGGGDMCQPQLDGVDININEMPQAGVPFYNYEKLTKTEDQVRDDIERMDRAYKTYHGVWLYSNEGVGAYEGWQRMVQGRFHKPSKHIPLSDHPKYIQETIANLRPSQFGYDGFGTLGRNDYA